MHLSISTIVLTIFGFLNQQYNSTELITNTNNNNNLIIDFLSNINEGKRFIMDYCDQIEMTTSIFNINNNEKPYCTHNYSYIDSNNTIHMFKMDSDLKRFFIEKRNEYCKQEDILCGELTILIKIFDLIESATDIILQDLDNNNLFINLKILDFDNLYKFYSSSFNNIDLLMNITLKKQKARIYLEKEKTKLIKEFNKQSYEKFTDYIKNMIGFPIKDSLRFIGGSTGGLFKEFMESVFPSISLETKLIIIGLISVIIFKR